jgi:hypothetical protein
VPDGKRRSSADKALLDRHGVAFDTFERHGELLPDGSLKCPPIRVAASGELPQSQQEKPAKARADMPRIFGKESGKQYHRDTDPEEVGERGIEKSRGVVAHDIIDVGCRRKIDDREQAERSDFRLSDNKAAGQQEGRQRDGPSMGSRSRGAADRRAS